MKPLYKLIITTVGMIIVFTLSVGYLSKSIISKIDNEKEKYEKYIGEKYVVNKDTLTIVDYSTLGETFTLSNGQKVNYKLILNN